MKRILFLVNHRSGSHFMQAMLRGDIDNTFVPGTFSYATNLPAPVWLHTDPAKQCLFYGVNDAVHKKNDLIYKPRKIVIPESYSRHADYTDTTEQIDKLSHGDWTIFFIYRDPRNRIESLLKRAESQPNCLPRKDLWKMFIERDAKLTRGILKMKADPRFHYIDFDIFFDNPMKGLTSMFSIVGYKPDTVLYQKLIPAWYNRHNSSYNDKGRERRHRWETWTRAEREDFASKMGNQLIKLGYEKDDTWIIRNEK